MRREPGSFVKESSRNDPETDFALPHHVLLSPHRNLHTDAGCRRKGAPSQAKASRPMGMGVRHRGMSMAQLVALCRSLRTVSLRFVALALCSAAIVFSVSPASARSHHGIGRHAYMRHAGRHPHRHYAHRHYRQYRHRHYRRLARLSRWDAAVAQMRTRGLAGANAGVGSSAYSSRMAMSGGFGSSNIVDQARRYIGGNPTGRGSLWCARFMNMVLQQSGYRGTGSDLARSFASYGAARIGTAGRRHRGDGAARRRPCRHHQRHRRRRQSDHDLRQQRQPGSRGAGFARPDLRLRHADALTVTSSPVAMAPPAMTSA